MQALPEAFSLQGKVIAVNGCSRGIGAEVCNTCDPAPCGTS